MDFEIGMISKLIFKLSPLLSYFVCLSLSLTYGMAASTSKGLSLDLKMMTLCRSTLR